MTIYNMNIENRFQNGEEGESKQKLYCKVMVENGKFTGKTDDDKIIIGNFCTSESFGDCIAFYTLANQFAKRHYSHSLESDKGIWHDTRTGNQSTIEILEADMADDEILELTRQIEGLKANLNNCNGKVVEQAMKEGVPFEEGLISSIGNTVPYCNDIHADKFYPGME